MFEGTARTLRYGRSWLTGGGRVRERGLELRRPDRTVPATLVLPRPAPRGLPGWVVLHGVTRPGRRHEQLVRFVRALAHSGAAVIVPEVPEWVELDLAPGTTAPTVKASIRALREEAPVDPGAPVGLMGFSFGAPQAVVASTDPEMAADVGGVVGFGGYCDLERTVRFQLTGRHQWRGREWRLRPDPYGRWIVAANFLTRVPAHRDAGDVADALWELAKEAGDRRIQSWDPVFDPLKEALRERVATERRELFDLFAPPSERRPDPDAAEAVVGSLVEAARRVEPLMEPGPLLGRVRTPVHLLHGRNDRLIPYTESLRLLDRLPDGVRKSVAVTGLFAHSSGHPLASWPERLRESVLFATALRRVLTAV